MKDDFAVVLKLTKKDGSTVDLLIHTWDDPTELANRYAASAGLPAKAVPKLAQIISSKRQEALNEYDVEVTHSLQSPSPGQHLMSSMSGGSSSATNTPTVTAAVAHAGSGARKLSLQPPAFSASSSPSSSASAQRGVSFEHVPSPSSHNNTDSNNNSAASLRGGSRGSSPLSVLSPISASGTNTSGSNGSPDSPSGSRLYDEFSKQQARQRRRSMAQEEADQAARDASSFIKQRAAQKSPSSGGSSPRGYSRDELEAAAAEIYNKSMLQMSRKEQALERIRDERDAQKVREEEEGLTFQPRLATAGHAYAKQNTASRRQSIVKSPPASGAAGVSPRSQAHAQPQQHNPFASPPARALSTASPTDAAFPGSRSPVGHPAHPHMPTPPSPDALPEGHDADEERPLPAYDLHTAQSPEALVQSHIQRVRASSAERGRPVQRDKSPEAAAAASSQRSQSQSPRGARGAAAAPAGGQEEGSSIVDWLYYQAVEDHRKARQGLQARLSKERTAEMPFRPRLSKTSERLAAKRREEKLVRYALLQEERNSSTGATTGASPGVSSGAGAGVSPRAGSEGRQGRSRSPGSRSSRSRSRSRGSRSSSRGDIARDDGAPHGAVALSPAVSANDTRDSEDPLTLSELAQPPSASGKVTAAQPFASSSPFGADGHALLLPPRIHPRSAPSAEAGRQRQRPAAVRVVSRLACKHAVRDAVQRAAGHGPGAQPSAGQARGALLLLPQAVARCGGDTGGGDARAILRALAQDPHTRARGLA